MIVGYLIRDKYRGRGTPEILQRCNCEYFEDWEYASIRWMYDEIYDEDQLCNGLEVTLSKNNIDKVKLIKMIDDLIDDLDDSDYISREINIDNAEKIKAYINGD